MNSKSKESLVTLIYKHWNKTSHKKINKKNSDTNSFKNTVFLLIGCGISNFDFVVWKPFDIGHRYWTFVLKFSLETSQQEVVWNIFSLLYYLIHYFIAFYNCFFHSNICRQLLFLLSKTLERRHFIWRTLLYIWPTSNNKPWVMRSEAF